MPDGIRQLVIAKVLMYSQHLFYKLLKGMKRRLSRYNVCKVEASPYTGAHPEIFKKGEF